jgi:hypothetical protein
MDQMTQDQPANLAEAMRFEGTNLTEALQESGPSRESIIDPRSLGEDVVFSNGGGAPDRRLEIDRENGEKAAAKGDSKAESGKNGAQPGQPEKKEEDGLFEFSWGKVDISSIKPATLAKMIHQDRLLSKAQSRAQTAENELKKMRSAAQSRQTGFDDDDDLGLDDDLGFDDDDDDDSQSQSRRDASGRFADKLDPELPENVALIKKQFEKARAAHQANPNKKTSSQLEDARQQWLEARQDFKIEQRMKSASGDGESEDPYSWTDYIADAEHYIGIFGLVSRAQPQDVAYAYERIVKVGVPQAEKAHNKKIDLSNPRVQAALWKEAIKISLNEKTDAGNGDGNGSGPDKSEVRSTEKPFWALSKSGGANLGQSADGGAVGRNGQPKAGNSQAQTQRSRFRNLGELMFNGQ